MTSLYTAVSLALLWPFAAARASVVITALPLPMQLDWSDQPGPVIDLNGVSHLIDINSDGWDDFRFGSSEGFASVQSMRTNRMLFVVSPPPNIGGPIAPVSIGAIIGVPFSDARLAWSSTDFVDGFVDPNEPGTAATIALQVSSGWASAFPEFGIRAPIGFEVHAADGVHYGYIDVFAGGRFDSMSIYGWAYESEPGVPIQAAFVPEPSTAAYIGAGSALILKRNAHTRKQNKALQRTPRGLFVSTLYLIRKWLGFGGAPPAPRCR